MLTIRALEVLRISDVVIYDRLVTEEVLQFIPQSALRICAGKTVDDVQLPQEEINNLMIAEARRGKSVVRLKGGDPFLFARGGEEAEAILAEGIDLEIVPGVSSALSVPEQVGIPLTHRKVSSSIAVVTGHEDPSKTRTRVNWSTLASCVDTLVILMGVATLHKVSLELMKGGLKPDTPVAIVEWGTTKRQKTTVSNLKEVAETNLRERISPPAVIVVGRVAALARELNWQSDTPPLAEVIENVKELSLRLRSLNA